MTQPDTPGPDIAAQIAVQRVRAERSSCSGQFGERRHEATPDRRGIQGVEAQARRGAFAALLADPPPAVERAVLARLREPTPEMLSRGADQWLMVSGEKQVMYRHIAHLWHAMIETRLAELDAEEKRDIRALLAPVPEEP